jgi:hypothetical protein
MSRCDGLTVMRAAIDAKAVKRAPASAMRRVASSTAKSRSRKVVAPRLYAEVVVRRLLLFRPLLSVGLDLLVDRAVCLA